MAEKCPSGLYDSCDMQQCTPVMRLIDESDIEAVGAAGFTVNSDYRGDWLRLCTAVLAHQHAKRMEAITQLVPEIDRASVELSRNTTRVLIAIDEVRYQDRVAVDRARGIL